MSVADHRAQDACGCCEGVSLRAPVIVHNRPGLSRIAYRIGGHGEVLASLQARLSSPQFPALAALRTRDSDDFSIALLDAFACMADVLTFYQERIANESYLRTAGERRSLEEMARLIGYRLRPGQAAETWLAFTMERPPAPAPSDEPTPHSGIPDALTLAPGVQVQSVPGPDEKPQTFETVEPVEVRPEWNLFKAQPSAGYLLAGRTDCYLAGVGNGLAPGDSLLFVGNEFVSGADPNRFEFRTITSVTLDAASERTRVTWNGALGAAAPAAQPQAHVLRKRAAVFGHNAPMWKTMPNEFRDKYEPLTGGGSHSADWPNYVISPVSSAVDLDAVYPGVVPGTGRYLVLSNGTTTRPFTVSGVSEVSRAEFAISGKVTRAVLAGTGHATFAGNVRGTAVHAASERLTLVDAPLTGNVGGSDELVLDRAVSGLAPGRTLIVAGKLAGNGSDAAEVVTLKSVMPQGGVSRLAFEETLQNIYQRASVVVHANVARATHGETVHQILGSGAARETHQRFELKHAPLTYVSATGESGTAAALDVRVNDIAWKERASLYGASADERAFVARVDEDGKASVQFGDGVRGARLPSGRDNLRAIYRKGLGRTGNLDAGRLTQLMTRPLGLKAVTNPKSSTGGVDADTVDHARRNMPLGVRTLGRAVSLRDYEDYARAYTGIAKARADVLDLQQGRTVFITVAGEDGAQPASDDPTSKRLLQSLRDNGDPRVRCELAAYVPASFRLGLRIRRHPDHEWDTVRAAVESTLRAAYSFDARDFGQTVARSEVIAVAHAVSGVLGVDVDYFYRDTTPALADWLTPAAASVDSAGNPVAAELLLLDGGPFDHLDEMT